METILFIIMKSCRLPAQALIAQGFCQACSSGDLRALFHTSLAQAKASLSQGIARLQCARSRAMRTWLHSISPPMRPTLATRDFVRDLSYFSQCPDAARRIQSHTKTSMPHRADFKARNKAFAWQAISGFWPTATP
ncbi:MAG: hypothetical protein Q4A97_02460 [Comamonadaceae bacterium]|nr:hypothetical protein [Comamonadaceae bacterium]